MRKKGLTNRIVSGAVATVMLASSFVAIPSSEVNAMEEIPTEDVMDVIEVTTEEETEEKTKEIATEEIATEEDTSEETLPAPSIDGAVVFRGEDGKLYETYHGVTVEINETDDKGEVAIGALGHVNQDIILDGETFSTISSFTDASNITVDPEFENINDAAFPAKYKSPYITSVKDQGDYGTCWSFATLGASEANYKKTFGKNYDLSESAMAYFSFNHIAKKADPLGGNTGDYTIPAIDNFLNNCGNQWLTTGAMASWRGPILETKAPYNAVTPTTVLNPSLAYGATTAHLTNAYQAPTSDRKAVKALIQKCGAVSGNIAAGYSDFWMTGSGYTSLNVPYNDIDTDHDITIVGWDDNFSQNNFYMKPQGNGAWLCKNSWGSDWGNQSGYFWLSYYDAVINESGTIHAFEFAKTSNYAHNYQYDANSGGYGFSFQKAGNIFTSKGNETIKAVGYFTIRPNVTTTITLYKGGTTAHPETGTKVASFTNKQTYAGYHTATLPKSFNVKKGEKFSVVISQKQANGDYSYIPVDLDRSTYYYNFVSATKAGQSFYYSDGAWKDSNKYPVNGEITDVTPKIKVFTQETSKVMEENVKAFVERMYTKALKRKSEAAGKDYWTKQIIQRKKTPVEVGIFFFTLDEYKNKKTSNKQFITDLYAVFMDRKPDAGGMNYWLGECKKQDRVTIIKRFAGCPEFKQICKTYGL